MSLVLQSILTVDDWVGVGVGIPSFGGWCAQPEADFARAYPDPSWRLVGGPLLVSGVPWTHNVSSLCPARFGHAGSPDELHLLRPGDRQAHLHSSSLKLSPVNLLGVNLGPTLFPPLRNHPPMLPMSNVCKHRFPIFCLFGVFFLQFFQAGR